MSHRNDYLTEQQISTLEAEMTTEFFNFTMKNGHYPMFAFVKVKWEDDPSPLDDIYCICLRPFEEVENEVNDDEILYYCDGLDGLVPIVKFYFGDFTITEFHGFSDK